MSNLAAKLFGGSAATVKVHQKGTPLELGEHTAKVKSFQLFETFDKGPAFVAEFECTEGPAAGKTRIWYKSLQGKSKSVGMNEIYALCMALDGLQVSLLTQEEKDGVQLEIEGKLSEMNPKLYNGSAVKIIAYNSSGKGEKADKTYTNCKFEAVTQ